MWTFGLIRPLTLARGGRDGAAKTGRLLWSKGGCLVTSVWDLVLIILQHVIGFAPATEKSAPLVKLIPGYLALLKLTSSR